MAIYDEIESKGLYGGVKAGAPLSLEESQSLGLPQLNPLQDELERAYEKHVTGNPDQAASRIWTAERVGIPHWIQDRDEMYKKEAETRLALLDKKSPDWNRMVAFSPATSKFLSHDDVMASAYDDVDNLAAMEAESKRAARVKKNLNGLLQRGASGRTAIMKKLKTGIRPSNIAPGTSDTAKGTVFMYGRDADTFAGMIESGNIDIDNRPVVHNEDGSISTVKSMSVDFDGKTYLIPTIADDGRELSFDDAVQMFKDTRKHLGVFENDKAATEYAKALSARQAKTYSAGPRIGRDADTSQFIDINKALGDWFMSTDIGKGYISGKEMTNIGIEAVNLFAAESATGSRDEAKWVELEKRRLAMDRDQPEGWFGEMLYATGKLYGQQASGAVRTSSMAATGAVLGAAAVGATAPVSLPAIGVIAGMTSLLGWKIGADLGIFTQSSQIEGGHDLIERRMMTDSEGNHLSPMAIGLGSMATGALNGALEAAQWTVAFSPLGKTATAAKIQKTVIPKVAASISALPAFAKMAGMTVKNIVANDFYESGTEVLQDAIPIAIDEFQKAALLGGNDMRSIGDISVQLQDTFRQSMFDFALISAIGPVTAGVRGDYRAEIVRKEMEARQVQHMNSNLDNFAAKIGASKLLQRIPGMSKDFAGELLDGADARTVYVPATSVQQMFQDGLIETEQEDAAAWAAETLGIDPGDFQASLDGGPDLEIEAIKLFDGVPDKAQDAIRKAMRFSADGITLGEAEAMNERVTKIRQGDLFNVAYELEREMSEAASAHKVFESMRMQMEAQGMEHEVAANTAWAASRMYIPMARMWNEKRTSQDMIMPEDVAEMFPISFTQNDDGSMGMYFQALGEKGAGQLDAAETVTMRLDNLDAAKRELAAGKSPLKVKVAYGWEQGVDGKWRMESDDDSLRLKAAAGTKAWRDLFSHTEKYGPKKYALLKDVISHDELFTAYPDMGDIKVYVDIDSKRGYGYYSEHENAIHLSYDTANYSVDTTFVIMHEIQHAIQAREGFARGGRSEMFSESMNVHIWRNDLSEAEDYAERARNPYETGAKIELRKILDQYNVETIEELRTLYEKETQYGQYKRLAGEVEARNATRRLAMSTAERRASLLSETEDVSREDQIILDSMLRKAELAEELRYFQATPVYIQSQVQAEFEKNVDAVIDNQYKTRDSLLLGSTPEVLKKLGIANLPIIMGQGHVYSTAVSEDQAKKDGRYSKDVNYHNMGKDNIKKLYDLISDPVMIITSETHPDDSIVVLVNMDKNGEPVIVPIVVEGFGMNKGLRIDASAVTSFLNKKNVLTKLVSDAVEKEKIGEIGILYLDKKTGPTLLRQAGVQFSAIGMQADELMHSLTEAKSPVNFKFSDITETKQFKRFFGDWLKTPGRASKVVDKEGKPLVVYHGTGEDFSEFRRDKLGSRENAFFFTSRKESAMEYGTDVMPVYLNARRFVRLDENYRDANGREYDVNSAEFRKKYDGYSVNEGTDYDEFVVFRPEQIKSVDNIGTFDTSDPNIYRQTSDGQHRGSITFPRQPGQPIRISWSKNADASTVIHELAHFYLWQLRQFRGVTSAVDAATGRYTRQAMDDLDVISKWWSEDAGQITDWIRTQQDMGETVKAGTTESNFINWVNSGMERESDLGKAFDVAAHEYFARGFEAYMREGKAPTAELQSVFRRFKKWLTDIYKSLTELNVELSDDVRAVYDRMLASEEAIEQFKAEMEIEDLLRSEEDDIPDDYPFDDEDPFEAAKERLLGILLEEISPENKKKMVTRAGEIRPRILAETMSEKGWAAVEFYRDNPDHRISEESVLDRYGEKVLGLMPPEAVDPDGITADIAAKDMGYSSADALIQDLYGKTSLKEEVDTKVRAQIEREFASIINDPAKLDAAVEAAWYEGEEHADGLAADMVVPMSEYAEIYAEDEAAAAEQESSRNRRNVISWIKSHGGVLYSSVSTEFGKERAQELIKKTGPGIFSKTGFGMDELAQEMSGNGIPIANDEDLFNVLMGEDAKQSPLDIARKEGRAEVIKESRMKRALDKMVKDEKKRLEKEIKSKYNEQIKGVKSAAEVAAENIVSTFAIEKLRDTAKYIRAEKEARRKADAALRKNDEAEFHRWRERELMQHMIVKQMYRSQRQAEGARSWLERYAKRTNTQTFGMTPNFTEQVDALLTRFDIRKQRSLTAKQRAMVREAPSLDNFIREMDAEGTPILIPDWILSSNETRHYTQLMLWQLQEVKDSIKNIVTVGRQEKETISLAQNEKLADIADKIYSAAKAFWTDRVTGERIIDPKERKRNVKELAKGYLADLETVEAMCRALDGFQDLGPAHRYIFQPIRTAMSKETLELNRVFALAREIRNKAYGGNPMVDNWSVQFNIPVYKRAEVEPGKYKMIPTKEKLSLTREQAICAVLNMGNEGNMARLRDGWGWTQQDMSEILNSLSEQDIRYIEGIWDLVESMWPQVKKVSEMMTGLTLAKVEAKPLITKFGTLKGGYYPIVTDLRYSTVAAAQSELETALASATLNYAHSHTKAGHRKARAVDVLGRPPMLSLGVLDNHLANVIHDAAVAPALRDVRKVLKNQLVETTILEVLGEDRKKNINKWLNDVAANTKNNGVSLSKGEVIANRARSGVAMFALGANLGGALMQPLGYFPLAHRIGLVRTARAILNGLIGNTDIYSFVLEKSEFMREPYNGQNVEVRKLRENWSSQKGGLKWYQDRMLDIYPMLQNLCNVPGWAEAYKMGIEKYEGNEADAIAFADSIIRQTQSASNLADLSTLERSGTFGSLVTMFYSWFRVMYQMQNESIIKALHVHGMRGRFGDLASYALYVLIAQGVAEALLRGYGPDDDDDDDGEAEKWAKWTAQRLMLGPISTVPIARDIVSVFEVGQYRFTPIEASFKSVSKLLLAAEKAINPPEGKERDLEPLIWSGAEVVGYSTGLPNRAMLRAAKSFWELYNEDEAIPWAYVILGGGFRPKK